MSNNKKITRGTKITSTSDVTIEDIVDFVADELPNNPCRAKIEKIVKDVVRPCAIGGIPTVVAGAGNDGTIGTVRFPGGVRGGISVGCSGAYRGECDPDGLEAIPGGKGSSGTNGIKVPAFSPVDGDMLMKRAEHANPTSIEKKLMKTSKWYDIVLQNGEVWTPYTSRRFLPAQYLAMMLHYNGNVDAAIARRYSLRDCFKLLDTEIEKLAFLETHWRVAFAERRLFLSVENCRDIFTQYLKALKDNLNDRNKCAFAKRAGEYWRKIQGEGRVVLWEQKTVKKDGPNGAVTETFSIEPSDWLINVNDRIDSALRRASTVTSYAKALDFLRARMPQISMGTFKDADNYVRYWLPKLWKELFKKQGAYYTLKALIVNRHVRFTTESGDWRHKDTDACENARDGLIKLRELADPKVPAYVVHAILKKSIETSKFDISKFLRAVCKR